MLMPFDESESEPLTESDGLNATKFHPEEAPEHLRDYYRRLSKYNYGLNLNWADNSEQRRQEALAIFDALSGNLELTPFQKRVGRARMDSLEIYKLGWSVEHVAFAVCAVTAREDGRLYHPNRSDDRNDSEFVRLARSLDLRPKGIDTCMQKITRMIERGDVL
jgi:hypothetical protein